MKLTKSKIVSIAAAVLGVVAIFMLLLAGLGAKDAPKGTEFPSMFNLMFGSGKVFEIASPLGTVKYGAFNFVLFVAFLFLLVGIALMIVSLFKDIKALKIAAIALFIVAGIIFFLTLNFAHLSWKSGVYRDAAKENLKKVYQLGIGAIMAGIMSLLAGVAACVGTFVIKD